MLNYIINTHTWEKIRGPNERYWYYSKCSKCNLYMASFRTDIENVYCPIESTPAFKFKKNNIHHRLEKIPTCNELKMNLALE